MKKLILICVGIMALASVNAQTKYFTKNGKVFFSASSPMEKIEATNEKAFSVLNDSAGTIEFAVLMKAFIFEKALMQEHFNENYAESDKFPKASFKGQVTNFSTVDMQKDGIYPVKIKGILNLHGESKEVLADGSLTVKDGKIASGKSQFKIVLADYKIDIPSVVKDKISKDVQINVDANYEQMKSS